MQLHETTDVLRLFIAIHVPDPVKDSIERAQKDFKESVGEGVCSWTKPEQFHLTLRFLGKVPARNVPRLTASLVGACAGFGALSLRAERIGFFPSMRYPRVIWVGVSDNANRLGVLHNLVEQAAASFTSERGEEHFHGHITLGRARQLARGDKDALAVMANQMVGRAFGSWVTKSVELLKSELSPKGARHSFVASAAL